MAEFHFTASVSWLWLKGLPLCHWAIFISWSLNLLFFYNSRWSLSPSAYCSGSFCLTVSTMITMSRRFKLKVQDLLDVLRRSSWSLTMLTTSPPGVHTAQNFSFSAGIYSDSGTCSLQKVSSGELWMLFLTFLLHWAVDVFSPEIPAVGNHLCSPELYINENREAVHV